MNIPALSGQSSVTAADYQARYAAPGGKNTFAQTLAEAQSAWFSLTTAEGDLVTLSEQSLSYRQTQGVGWVTPTSSGVNISASFASSEIMGLSVQGDLNAQELADITRLVGELTSIASSFFSGDQETALTKAVSFGDVSLGSISSLAASFSSQSLSQTRLTSHSSLSAMADLHAINFKDFYQNLGMDQTGTPDYASLLETRWQQILKTLETAQNEELNNLLTRKGEEPKALALAELPAGIAEPALQPEAIAPPPVFEAAQPTAPALPSRPAQAARQMLTRLEQLFAEHPKFTPFAKDLAFMAMEKSAADTQLPEAAKALSELQQAFTRELRQWYLPASPPKDRAELISA